MLKFQNSKRRCARHRSVVKWGAFALLAVTAVATCAGFIDVHHLPSFAHAFDFSSILTIASLPMLGAITAVKEEKKEGEDDKEDTEYEPKDEFEKAVLASAKKFQALQKAQDTEIKVLKEAYDDFAAKLLVFQKSQIPMKARFNQPGRPGEVSVDCARHLGSIAFAIALKTGQLSGRNAELVENQVKEILGAEWRAALTTSDIPLPVEYSPELVELVSRFGTARRYGTVFPLGAGSVKLPKLTTDTAFGLIAMSGTVTEVSPQIAFVTFNAEKFGGLVRLPSEIDEDSIVPMGQFIARYAARNIAKVEDVNFWASTGADSGANGAVKGLTGSTIDNSKVVQMASTKTHYSDATLANLRAIRAVPDEAALEASAYYLHPTFEQLLSTFNTAGDRPYNPNAQLAGASVSMPLTTGPTLDGWPIRWINTLPVYSASANVSKVFVLFGDPSFQYLGIRGGVRFATSLEAGFATDEILIRALERLTIGLMANGAVGGLQTAAS
jgi:HK97 family phage major capsid protein